MSEGFLSRWSRLKRQPEPSAKDGDTKPTTEQPALSPEASSDGVSSAASNTTPHPWSGTDPSLASAAALPSTHENAESRQEDGEAGLPALESLLPDSDFRPFMKAGVAAATRNAALKKLFTDPGFNVMDGLDIYVGDYSQPDPIPPDMLKGLMESDLTDFFRLEREDVRGEPAAQPVGEGVQAAEPARALTGSGKGHEPGLSEYDKSVPGAGTSDETSDGTTVSGHSGESPSSWAGHAPGPRIAKPDSQ